MEDMPLFIAIVVFIFILGYGLFYNDKESINKIIKECERQNGVYLKSTKGAGKYETYEYFFL